MRPVSERGPQPTEPTPGAALIEANLDLVSQVVMQVAIHFPRHVDRGDLARAGALGLVEAAQRFDASRGVPFDKFAARRIRGAILDSVRAADWAPRSVRTLARKLEQVEQQLANLLGRLPDPDDLAKAMGLSHQELFTLRDKVARSVVLALEYVVAAPDDEDLTLVDVLADRTELEPSEQLETRELLGYLRDAVHLLPERHRTVIVGYFLEGRTSLELAECLGVTESRISQLRTEALDLMRAGIEGQYRTPSDAKTTEAQSHSSRRRVAYVAAVGEASDWRTRLSVRAGAA
ncbi:MAG: sigma-70 family RNA polymerase sigma factor [Acidimicrobiales bacterium]